MAQHFTVPAHICMLDGPDYPNETTTGKSRYDDLIEENGRLKALLVKHGISWVTEEPKKPVRVHKMKTRKSTVTADKQLPHLPMEIQLRILGFVMQCPFPIIDPFSKPRLEHLTKEEQAQRKEYPIYILGTCKAYLEEGRKLFFNNSFIFTQAIALENFSYIPRELRQTINSVGLRVVGKYYDDEASKRNILGISYHPAARGLKIPVQSRPRGAAMDGGIHAYCWQQFTDFMKNMQMSSRSGRLSKLFPSLTRMRIDLVNFCDHLHYPGPSFSTVLRWHTGIFLDELIITGIPDDDPQLGPETIFTNIVRDEGVFGTGPPIFISQQKFLKALNPLDLDVRVIRADDSTKARRLMQSKNGKARKGIRACLDPADGKPPQQSVYPPGRTIWKFTQLSLKNPERKWVEFDRESGYQADEIDIWGDEEDSQMYDSDGSPLYSDEELLSLDDEMEDDNMEDDDDLPLLVDL